MGLCRYLILSQGTGRGAWDSAAPSLVSAFTSHSSQMPSNYPVRAPETQNKLWLLCMEAARIGWFFPWSSSSFRAGTHTRAYTPQTLGGNSFLGPQTTIPPPLFSDPSRGLQELTNPLRPAIHARCFHSHFCYPPSLATALIQMLRKEIRLPGIRAVYRQFHQPITSTLISLNQSGASQWPIYCMVLVPTPLAPPQLPFSCHALFGAEIFVRTANFDLTSAPRRPKYTPRSSVGL